MRNPRAQRIDKDAQARSFFPFVVRAASFPHGGGDKRLKERMRLRRLRFEFRVILNRDEPRMLVQFDDFDEFAVGTGAGNYETAVDKAVAIFVVELIPMSMTWTSKVP